MSVPVIPVSAGTLVVPLVGDLDAQRIGDLQTQTLGAVERSHCRRLVLDITGVPVVDSAEAPGSSYKAGMRRLLEAAQAAFAT